MAAMRPAPPAPTMIASYSPSGAAASSATGAGTSKASVIPAASTASRMAER